MAKAPTIGRLRWTVSLFRRDQSAGPQGGILEVAANAKRVHCDIQPLAPMTFLEGEQTDTPITHRVLMRWVDWLDYRYAMVRQTRRRDGTVRAELFRIRRIAEFQGRKQFVELLVEEERRE